MADTSIRPTTTWSLLSTARLPMKTIEHVSANGYPTSRSSISPKEISDLSIRTPGWYLRRKRRIKLWETKLGIMVSFVTGLSAETRTLRGIALVRLTQIHLEIYQNPNHPKGIQKNMSIPKIEHTSRQGRSWARPRPVDEQMGGWRKITDWTKIIQKKGHCVVIAKNGSWTANERLTNE